MDQLQCESVEFSFKSDQRTFDSDASQAAFLLGGIGTGNVSVGARGELRDWEIFNSPSKGTNLPYSFFSIRVKEEGGESIAKVLESRMSPPFSKPLGFQSNEVAGLPRLKSSVMRGEYPFVRVDFIDDELPVSVSMEAFTPFIPLNADDSGIPAAIIRYRVSNKSNRDVAVTILGSLANAVGYDGLDRFGNLNFIGENTNTFIQDGKISGLHFTSSLPEDHLKHGSMALMTTDTNITYKTEWLKGSWLDGIIDFWDDFRTDGKLEPISVLDGVKANFYFEDRLKVGSLGILENLEPQRENVFEFILSWHFPNRVKGWEGTPCQCCKQYDQIERNYYGRLFVDAWHAGSYLISNMQRLEKLSRDFHRALFGSTLPWYVIDALAVNITVIRSNTCFRIEDGTLLSWEGCLDDRGSCEGNCTHVWNYAQTMAFLFPELERTMRRVEFSIETDEDGKMAFRTWQALGHKKWEYLPAADGQLGTIVRLYRDWKYSGDDVLLGSLWDKARKALDFAEGYWDKDGDHVLDSQQHNTYDIEFYGPNSLTNSIYFSALKAASEIEKYLGNEERAKKYEEAFESGSKRMDALLWDGDYYIQQIGDIDKYRYQYGSGCLSDQVFGQLLAHIAGLGYILPREHVKKALYSVYKNNFKPDFQQFHNTLRAYVFNDESGLLLCTWPKNGRPRLPFIYCDEVWTGIEYQIAAHLIYEGFPEEGLAIVKAVRERHDGYKRNPWNEVECGYHYVRSMASWALLPALSGFRFDLVKGEISFKPACSQDDFTCFFSTGKAWGIYKQERNKETGRMEFGIETIYGSMEGIKVNPDFESRLEYADIGGEKPL